MAKYGAENIKILDDLEHIKLRKGIYIGEAHDPRQLLSEIFDNAIDEVQSKHSTKLQVTVDTKLNKYMVRDWGRGIPHGQKALGNGQKKEILEILITKANSGGKFDNSSYNYSSGLNGLGLTVTNALSTYMAITSFRDGKYVKVEANSSTKVVLTKGDTTEPNGTIVEFIPDKTVFKSCIIPQEFIINRCKIASALGFQADLVIDGVKLDTKSDIFGLINEEDDKIVSYVDIPLITASNKEQELMKVALRYSSDTKDRYFGYTNLLSNYLGGTHVTVLSRTLINCWEAFINKNKKLAPSVTLKPSDYLIGLRAVVAVFISNPEFSSQTKEKLVVHRTYFDDLMSNFSKSFTKYLGNNILIAQQLIKRFEEYRVAQNALLSRKEISSLIKVNDDSSDNIRRRSIVSKLVECTSKKRDNTELFIVEGDSAMGPYLYVRDKETQAVLPIRGKILNTTYKEIKEVLKNKEVLDIANSIGCGIGSNCDANKSRYERIIISADADPDGLQINSLVLALFINMFPDMVKQGRVFVSLPPLYSWGNNVKNYGWTDKIAKVPKNAKNLHRFKGLGEMNPDQLNFFLVDPTTRNVLQIEYPSDIAEFNRILGTSQGKNDLMKELGIIIDGEE